MEDVETLVDKAEKLMREFDEAPDLDIAKELQLRLSQMKLALGPRTFDSLPAYRRYLEDATAVVDKSRMKAKKAAESRYNEIAEEKTMKKIIVLALAIAAALQAFGRETTVVSTTRLAPGVRAYTTMTVGEWRAQRERELREIKLREARERAFEEKFFPVLVDARKKLVAAEQAYSVAPPKYRAKAAKEVDRLKRSVAKLEAEKEAWKAAPAK